MKSRKIPLVENFVILRLINSLSPPVHIQTTLLATALLKFVVDAYWLKDEHGINKRFDAVHADLSYNPVCGFLELQGSTYTVVRSK